MPIRPLSRRALLRGTGICLALPFLDIMRPERASAADAAVQRFMAFFYPCGTDPRKWKPAAGALAATSLPECLQDLTGFAAEGIWPAEESALSDVTVVNGIDHSGVCVDIHMPSMALSAYKGTENNYTPPQPTLDQVIADQVQGTAPYRNFALSATGSTDIGQGNISFREGGQVESVVRDPRRLFDTLFGGGDVGGDDSAAEAARRRQASVLDLVKEDAGRLNGRLGAADRARIDQYLTAVREVEMQVGTMNPTTCATPTEPGAGGNWHSKSKAFIDLAVLAMACDLTRVVTLQYSDSWGVTYSDYALGEGQEALKDWSDHFISHKLDDTDRATDLDGLDRTTAQRIADARVVLTSRFKVRRYMYIVNALKRATTAAGNLLDETLLLFVSENGDGDSHSRKDMPILLAGHAGGFETGRAVDATNKPTAALHTSILQRYGIEASNYGNPMGTPIAGL
jgi:hypothetical protein